MGLFSKIRNALSRVVSSSGRQNAGSERTVIRRVPIKETGIAGLAQRLGLRKQRFQEVRETINETARDAFYNPSDTFVVEGEYADVAENIGIPFSKTYKGSELNSMGNSLPEVIASDLSYNTPPPVDATIQITGISKL